MLAVFDGARGPLTAVSCPSSIRFADCARFPGHAGWEESIRSTPGTFCAIRERCSSPGPTTFPSASRTSRACAAPSVGPESWFWRQSRWMCVTFVLIPSRCTWYVGSRVARTVRLSTTLYFFFDLPTVRMNLSFTVAWGSPRTIEEMSAMLDLPIFVSSTLTSTSPASTSPLSSAEDPPTTSFTTSCPSGLRRNISPTPQSSFLSRRCTAPETGLFSLLPCPPIP
mmetsp:Transcript_23892/g.54957  ORF Transcript_23892/g.54957 Transcript_23892/m.54957 type:complete len:225 (+) Transcript_23892:56-730(+)